MMILFPNTEQKKKKLKIHRFRLYQRHGQCHQQCNLYGSNTHTHISDDMQFSPFHYNLNVQYHNSRKKKKKEK